MSRLRQRVAERLVQAQQTAAILTTFNEMNMQPVMELRSRYKDRFEKEHGVRLGFMSFFCQGLGPRAREVSGGQRLHRRHRRHLSRLLRHRYRGGLATWSGRTDPSRRGPNVVLPTSRVRSTTSHRGAQSGGLGLDELIGGTFTISNGGVFGSLLSTPILNPPQSAILGMHKTQERPMAENGQVVIRPMMYLALSYDHRIIDGREAVQFLNHHQGSTRRPGSHAAGSVTEPNG